MNARERIRRAWGLESGLPDRVPVQFDLCESLLRHFGRELDVPVSITRNLYEDVTWRISGNEVRLALGSDLVLTGASEASTFVPLVRDDGTWLNEYGMRMRQGTIYVEVVEYPLAHVQTAADVTDAIVLPDLLAPGRFDDAASLVAEYGGDYFVIGDIEVTIFTLVQQMVGMEKLMIDMAMGEEYLPRLIEIVTDFHIEHGLRLMDQGVDALWAGDDFGSQTGLLFSREMFRDLWKPAYARMCGAFREHNPDVALLLHCDGAVSELMDDFIDVGFQVFNPVQPGVPGHGPRDMKDGWGGRIGFWGAIDQQDLIPRGTDEELARDVQEKIAVLGEGGGYVIAPAHILQPDVSPERVRTFVELCHRYGSIY